MRRILFDLYGLFMKLQTPEGVAGIHRAARLETIGAIRPALLSNIPHTHLAYIRETMPWISEFEPAVFSCEHGLAKPDAALYLRACEEMGSEPADVLFLDDTFENVVGAREAGLRAVHFIARDQAWSDIEAFLNGENIGRH